VASAVRSAPVDRMNVARLELAVAPADQEHR
jgi:hypothetical protein